MKKVIIGISGGIDSALTAYKLKKEGCQVHGIHLKITSNVRDNSAHLRKISDELGIPIKTIDCSKEFDDIVIANFRENHLLGRTPSPCAICNPNLKWKILLQTARFEGADLIGTGHYIQKEKIGDNWFLKKSVDSIKDQSYFLWALPQDIIKKIVTPLGNTNKQENIKLASEIGLDFLCKQKESTGLCFSNGLCYDELIRKYIPEHKTVSQGRVLNSEGNEIGKHKGYLYYTIGQKKGIEYYNSSDIGKSIYHIDPVTNTITVGSESELLCDNFIIDGCKYINEELLLNCKELQVKVRGIGRNPVGFGMVSRMNNNQYSVKLENPAWAMAPGQPVVFYSKDILLGGGLMLK